MKSAFNLNIKKVMKRTSRKVYFSESIKEKLQATKFINYNFDEKIKRNFFYVLNVVDV